MACAESDIDVELSPEQVEPRRNRFNFRNVIHSINLLKRRNIFNCNVSCKPIDVTTKKEDYRIAICQDGKFAVTFDTGKFHYRKISAILVIFFLMISNFFFKISKPSD